MPAKLVNDCDVLQSRQQWLKESNHFRSERGALETISYHSICKPSHCIRCAIGRELSYRPLLLPRFREKWPEAITL
jgi:hypothetical protein